MNVALRPLVRSAKGLVSVACSCAVASVGSALQVSAPAPRLWGGASVNARKLSRTASSLFLANPTHGGARVSSSAEVRYPPTEVPEPERLCVIGDIHGDISQFRKCLEMADLVDSEGRWSGGQTVLVQNGDVFDRGDTDLAVEEWLYCLVEEAEKANGAVHMMLGNHEVLCAMGDHRYATRGAFEPFDELRPELDAFIDELGLDWSMVGDNEPEWAKSRIAAMSPGGPVANIIAGCSTCLKVGPNLLVHAGLLPSILKEGHTLESINHDAHNWLRGAGEFPRVLDGPDGPLWTRKFSSPDGQELAPVARELLDEVLEMTGCKRMIVGHTPQRIGINLAADGGIIRCDTGMTSMMGGEPEVLEILSNGQISILTESGPLPASSRMARPIRQVAPNIAKGREYPGY